MKKKLGLVLVSIGLLGVLAACSSPQQQNDNSRQITATPSRVTASDDNTDNDMPGTYQEYSAEAVAAANGKQKVLFFYAGWCPSCREQDQNLEQSKNEIPADVAIFKVDFDSEIELRQKYGVTTQHTLVEIDDNGDELEQWSSLYRENDLQGILDHLN